MHQMRRPYFLDEVASGTLDKQIGLGSYTVNFESKLLQGLHDVATNEASSTGNENPGHQTLSSGIAVTNCAPNLRTSFSCSAISAFRFHGRMTM